MSFLRQIVPPIVAEAYHAVRTRKKEPDYLKPFLSNLRGIAYELSEISKVPKEDAMRFISEFEQIKDSAPDFPITRIRPFFKERFEPSGIASGHYFHQDLFVAQQIFERRPSRHLDIGSRFDGFVAHVASFREIEVMDIRPQSISVKNIAFRQGDIMSTHHLPIDRYDSISCLHALEHFGLGRYGDSIDANGHIKAIQNIHEMLEPGGTFYLSTPIGTQHIEFNAHRVFGLNYLMNLLSYGFDVSRLAFVDDSGDFHRDISIESRAMRVCEYGCIILVMKRR